MGIENSTLAVEDFFDLVVMLMNNGYVPTDCLIHPLTWTVFVKNGLINIFANPAMGGANNQLPQISTDATSGRLPVNMNIMASPFIPFDMDEKTFDMYVVDRSSIGAIVVRDEMSTDQFEDPYRDIQNLKFRERYGIGIYDEGKAVTVAKNISLDTSYPKPEIIRTIKVADYTGQ